MSSERHAIAQLTSDTHPRLVPQSVIDDVVDVLAERDAEENQLREMLADEKLLRQRAENAEKQALDDLSDCRGALITARQRIRYLEVRLGIRDDEG